MATGRGKTTPADAYPGGYAKMCSLDRIQPLKREPIIFPHDIRATPAWNMTDLVRDDNDCVPISQ